MKLTLHGTASSTRLVLQPGEILSFQPPLPATSISCVVGRLHVTQTGDPKDHILEPGDFFRCAPRGKVVVSSFTSAMVTVMQEQHAPRPWAARRDRRTVLVTGLWRFGGSPAQAAQRGLA